MGKKSFLPIPGTGQALTTWLPTEILNQIDELAAERGVSRSTLAREAVLNFLNVSKNETPAA